MTLTRHIVWDWNGTVLGDGEAMIRSVISAFADTGLGSVSPADHRSLFMRPIPEFFSKLARRRLTDDEQRRLQVAFTSAYDRFAPRLALSNGALSALNTWSETGRTQSLLSMAPQPELLPLVRQHGVFQFFSRVDGFTGTGPDTKACHLKRHLSKLRMPASQDVVLVGDTTDDVLAAREAGIGCVAYYSGDHALQSLDRLETLKVPIARSLAEVIARMAM